MHGAVVLVTVERAEATTRVDVPTAPRESVSFVLLNSFMDRRETGWLSREKRNVS